MSKRKHVIAKHSFLGDYVKSNSDVDIKDHTNHHRICPAVESMKQSNPNHQNRPEFDFWEMKFG